MFATGSTFLTCAVAFSSYCAVYGRPNHPEEEGIPPPRGPAQFSCSPNEYQFWGSHEWGCRGLIAITPGTCICNEGLYRRETDNACVTKNSCTVCPVNEMQFFGVSEEGCNGNVPIHPGDCICKNGFFRRESDRACVQNCGGQRTCNPCESCAYEPVVPNPVVTHTCACASGYGCPVGFYQMPQGCAPLDPGFGGANLMYCQPMGGKK